MSQVFEGYERQYCELSANLSRKCTSAGLLDGEQKKQKVSEIKAGLDDGDALIRKMDLEARSLPPSVKAMLLAKLREYKNDLNNLKSEVKRITSPNATQAARDELLESGMADTMMVSADQKGRLLMSTERLNKSSDKIKESRRTMLETEELGVSILHDLHQQRQSLLHANNTVSADQKGRLLMSTERLNKSCDKIKESRRTMLETEELGVSVLHDLHQQCQSLLHTNNNTIPTKQEVRCEIWRGRRV